MTKVHLNLNPDMVEVPPHVHEAIAIVQEVDAQLVEARADLKKNKGALTRNKNKGAEKSVLKLLQAEVDACAEFVENCEQDLVIAIQQVERLSYMDANGGVDLDHIGKFKLDEIDTIYVPVVPVLPMRGDLETDFSGRSSGTTVALSYSLNIEKYGDLITDLFHSNLDQVVYQKGVDAIESMFSEEEVEAVGRAVANGSRPAVRIVAKRKAVAINIESPGGSPSESSVLSVKIRREAQKTGLQVLTFTNNMACSGGYWLLCSGDEMYSMPLASIGNIGVIGGYRKLTEWGKKRIPIAEHILTSGDEKISSLDDLMKDADPEDIEKRREKMRYIHTQFKEHVIEARCDGADISGHEDEVFSGATFFGSQGYELGLVDGLGYYENILEEKFGENVCQPVMDVADDAFVALKLAQAQSSTGESPQKEAASAAYASANLGVEVRHRGFEVLAKSSHRPTKAVVKLDRFKL